MLIEQKAREIAQIFGKRLAGNAPDEIVHYYQDSKISILANYFNHRTTVYSFRYRKRTMLEIDRAGKCTAENLGDDWKSHINQLYEKAMALVDQRQKLLGKEI